MDKGLVLFSGGLDSSVCLGWSLKRYGHVETIGFDYGQRHSVEMECRKTILSGIADLNPVWGAKLGQDHRVDLTALSHHFGTTAMTDEVEITVSSNGIPNTFVPGRNLLFFTISGGIAYTKGIRHLVGGMCEGGETCYPDCSDNTLKAQQVTLSLGLGIDIAVHTPRMWKSKAETFMMAHDLGGERFVDLVRRHSHSCYLGNHSLWNEWGYGCGTCPACILRAQGWQNYLSMKPH